MRLQISLLVKMSPHTHSQHTPPPPCVCIDKLNRFDVYSQFKNITRYHLK